MWSGIWKMRVLVVIPAYNVKDYLEHDLTW